MYFVVFLRLGKLYLPKKTIFPLIFVSKNYTFYFLFNLYKNCFEFSTAKIHGKVDVFSFFIIKKGKSTCSEE